MFLTVCVHRALAVFAENAENVEGCSWTINCPGGTTTLQVTHLDTEGCCDRVNVRTNSGQSLAELSGGLGNQSQISFNSSQQLIVTLTFDGSGTSGPFFPFAATYSCSTAGPAAISATSNVPAMPSVLTMLETYETYYDGYSYTKPAPSCTPNTDGQCPDCNMCATSRVIQDDETVIEYPCDECKPGLRRVTLEQDTDARTFATLCGVSDGSGVSDPTACAIINPGTAVGERILYERCRP